MKTFDNYLINQSFNISGVPSMSEAPCSKHEVCKEFIQQRNNGYSIWGQTVWT